MHPTDTLKYYPHGTPEADVCRCIPCSKYRVMLSREIRRALGEKSIPSGWVKAQIQGSTSRARALYRQIVEGKDNALHDTNI